ncbi:MAG TPA: hypothetical protein VMM12_05615 [Longimicrobiales bacterium]|nr:hypothetical protein [Longimicrobiales bacterium]
MSKSWMTGVMVAAGVLLGGCGGEGERAPDADTGQTDAPMLEHEGMPGMDMGPSGGMMGEMAAHMARTEGMRGDSLMAQLPTHRQLVANMIAQMNREMRQMDMGADAAWNATVDSLREDLVRIPDMDAAELQAMMPEHRARMTRLMEMHRAMMEDMGR